MFVGHEEFNFYNLIESFPLEFPYIVNKIAKTITKCLKESILSNIPLRI